MKAPILLAAFAGTELASRTHSSISALVNIKDSVEQERKREELIKLDDFDDCIEEKEAVDLSVD